MTSVSSVVDLCLVRSAVPLFLERFPLLEKCLGGLPDRTSALGHDRPLHEPIEVTAECGAMIGRERARTHDACATSQAPCKSPSPRAAATAQ